MATPYTDIYDSFMQVIKDYQLVDLYEDSPSNFNTYLLGFLIDAIIDFNNCNQDLSDRNDVTFTFNIDLTDEEIYILAQFMTKFWLMKEVNDSLQIKNLLGDKDFKRSSASNNLDKKQNYLSVVEERVDHLTVRYAIDTLDWDTFETDFNSGVFQ